MKKIFYPLIIIVFSAISLTAQNGSEAKKGSLDINYEPGIETLQQRYIEQNKSAHKLVGYRIQIYNGNKGACEKARSRFLSVFRDYKVHTVYEAPEYKVQVGDFRTRLEAEKHLQNVLNAFSGSFVVKSHIEYPDI